MCGTNLAKLGLCHTRFAAAGPTVLTDALFTAAWGPRRRPTYKSPSLGRTRPRPPPGRTTRRRLGPIPRPHTHDLHRCPDGHAHHHSPQHRRRQGHQYESRIAAHAPVNDHSPDLGTRTAPAVRALPRNGGECLGKSTDRPRPGSGDGRRTRDCERRGNSSPVHHNGDRRIPDLQDDTTERHRAAVREHPITRRALPYSIVIRSGPDPSSVTGGSRRRRACSA